MSLDAALHPLDVQEFVLHLLQVDARSGSCVRRLPRGHTFQLEGHPDHLGVPVRPETDQVFGQGGLLGRGVGQLLERADVDSWEERSRRKALSAS